MSATAAPAIDINVLLSTILGGLIAITGSLAVAWLYIRNQNKTQKKAQLREMIDTDYFDNCINPTLGALAEYGMSTAFALLDSSYWIGRSVKYSEVTSEELKKKLQEISTRPLVSDLTNHDFALVAKYRPLLQRFGPPIQVSLIRTLQFYSSIVADATNPDVLKRNFESTSAEEVSRSLGVLAVIVERTLGFLEKRFIDLREYLLERESINYDQFYSAFDEENYGRFSTLFKEYIDGLTKLMDALKGMGDSASASLSFSSWLSDNIGKNPLKRKLKEINHTNA